MTRWTDRWGALVAAWGAWCALVSVLSIALTDALATMPLATAFIAGRGLAYTALVPALWRGQGRPLAAALFFLSAVVLTGWHIVSDPLSLQVSSSLLQLSALAGWGVASIRARRDRLAAPGR